MTRAELLGRIAALEKVAPGPRLAFANERLLHDLQVHQAEMETHNRELREAQQLIELSRDRYADLFDFAPVGYVTLDDKGLIREINLTAAGLLGEERARLVGKPFRLHVARADLAEFRAHLRALTEPDQHTAAELQLIRKGRPALPVLMQSMLVAGAEPGLRLYRTTLTDLTARKQAEEERQKFVSLADNSSDFIGMCDRDFIPFYANAAALRLAGLADLAAACRTKVQDYFFPEDQPFITNEFFPRVLRDGHGEVEIRFRHFQTGAAIWMLYNVFAIRAASGTPVGWATVSRDITERRRAEEQTRELQNFLSSIVENIPMMLFVKDATDLRFVRVNKEEEKRVGHTREEMIGRTDFDFFPREQAELFVRSDREALEKGALTDIPEEAVSTPQGLRIFHTKKIPICDAQGHPAYLLGISEDITGRRQVEELLRSRSLQQQAVAEFGQHALAGRDLARLLPRCRGAGPAGAGRRVWQSARAAARVGRPAPARGHGLEKRRGRAGHGE